MFSPPGARFVSVPPWGFTILSPDLRFLAIRTTLWPPRRPTFVHSPASKASRPTRGQWRRRLGLVALGASLTGISVGCAEERDPINRVQPQAIPKSFFLGQNFEDPADNPEFYARSMVVDVPYGVNSDAFVFTNTINVI